MRQYELKLRSGKRVIWDGNDPIDASRNYVANHPAEAVVAWRDYPRTNFITEIDSSDPRTVQQLIVEPGHPLWERKRSVAE